MPADLRNADPRCDRVECLRLSARLLGKSWGAEALRELRRRIARLKPITKERR